MGGWGFGHSAAAGLAAASALRLQSGAKKEYPAYVVRQKEHEIRQSQGRPVQIRRPVEPRVGLEHEEADDCRPEYGRARQYGQGDCQNF
jgi:hypothetical protein